MDSREFGLLLSHQRVLPDLAPCGLRCHLLGVTFGVRRPAVALLKGLVVESRYNKATAGRRTPQKSVN